jgi:hypothetical protein
MKHYSTWLWILLSLAVFGVSAVQAQDDVGTMLSRVNNLRASLGLYPYTVSSALSAAAQQQARWIADNGSVSHTHPDGSGPRTRAVNAGYPSTDVSENIYGGTMATVDVAWTFWLNSGVHYAGLVNHRYTEVGFGVASSAWGTAYVMVFGNPGGPSPFVAAPAAAAAGSGGGGGGAAAAAAPPSYVVGTDRRGNIMHEVQPGDTLGDIAMIYGYTWDDLPDLMALNGLTDVMDLEVGSIFLVPPAQGTYTPSPVGDTPTPAATQPPTWTPRATFALPITATPWATAGAIGQPVGPATAGAAPAELLDPAATSPVEPVAAPLVVQAPTEAPGTPSLAQQGMVPGVTITRSGPSPWLGVALVVQVVILVGAAFEFVRRTRRRK